MNRDPRLDALAASDLSSAAILAALIGMLGAKGTLSDQEVRDSTNRPCFCWKLTRAASLKYRLSMKPPERFRPGLVFERQRSSFLRFRHVSAAHTRFWRAVKLWLERQCHPKHRTAFVSIFDDYLAIVGLNNRTGDRQAHAHPLLLGGEEGSEHLW